MHETFRRGFMGSKWFPSHSEQSLLRSVLQMIPSSSGAN